MGLVQWNSELSVGIPSIDSQHKKLVELVNTMHEAMLTGKGKDIVAKILSELITYTKTHFKHEEDYMERTAYPQTAVHALQHAQLTKKVLDLQSKVESGTVTITMEVMNFLKSWLQDHIMKMDKAYEQHFKQHGLK
ncbi:MAG: bacteriohemerythrin [Bacteroidetes bacterium]|nr:bacteriohemerythrin [Bacteroidota bacterium]